MAHLAGDLSVMPISDVTVWLGNRQMTGHLRIENGRVGKTFDIVDGQVARAASNDPREYFGQFLVHFGLLTEDQLQRAFETQNETQVLLGRILVMIGIVPEVQVIQTLRVKMSESLLDTFRWKNGTFVFENHTSQEDRPQIDVTIPLIDVHREGLARSEMWARLQEAIPDKRWILKVNDARVPATLTPDTLDGRIIALARHGLSIEAITLDLHATDYQMAERLLELYNQGAITPHEPSHTLLPLSSSASVAGHVERARAAMEQERYSEALRWVDEGAQVGQQDSGLDQLREELSQRAQRDGELDRKAIPVLRMKPQPEHLKRLSAKQRYVLARIDGSRSVEAIIQVSPMHDREALEILRQFEADRWVELHTTL
ncbi:MAG: DUF4388 domain-containing protein [Myxococcota bacterium]